MPRAGVRHDLVRLALALEDRAQLGDVGVRDDRVLLAEEAQVRAAKLRRQIERARRLDRVRLGVAKHPVPRHTRGEPRHRARRHQRVLPAHAEPRDADGVPIDLVAAREVGDGSGQVGEDARVRQRTKPAEDGRHVGQIGGTLARVEVDGEHMEPLGREAAGDVAVVLAEAAHVRDDDEPRQSTLGVRARRIRAELLARAIVGHLARRHDVTSAGLVSSQPM